ncbi:putative succinate-semialdehyde dehydrogenase [Dictyocaulus viviparus]|uniref:Succinate-semialdehyde dehydrogenase, mitochondrial n=1 Tax=Dictyocaulus viviparus TaxID=29172 RepID=A0A0D8Y774_DICVI|nr:putative succinate-semialdehyde dehydrogenase [Dictyocaulus viviparus]
MLNSRIFVISSRFSSSFTSPLLPKGALAYINGFWVSAEKKKTFDVHNPYTGGLLCKTVNCDVYEAEKAVTAAKEAFNKWSVETTPKQRGALLRKWYDILVEKEQQLAHLLTLEQGKPLAEARGEIQYSASFLDWYAGEARRIYGQVVSPAVLNREHTHIREPIGVAVVITPWNFPTAMIARKAGAALAAGCTLITAEEAGLPAGVFNVLPADRKHTAAISKYLCENKDVDVISFTGSTAVGKILLTQSASTVKRVCLELGGNAPFLVFDSANLDIAVKSAMVAKFRCSGQTCVAADRFFIHKKVHDDFVTKMINAMKHLVVGDGMSPKTTIGPLINDNAVKRMEELLKDATAKGAHVVLGGKRGKGTCFQPTLLTNVTENMDIAHTEIFGPIVAVQKFTDEESVLAAANETRSGLAGYVFSNDTNQIYRITRRLQVGMIGVNEGLMSCAEAAFGGVKESGHGREGASQGIDNFTEWKYICIQH